MIRIVLILIRNPVFRSWYLNSSLHSCSCEVQQLKIIIIIIIIILVESNPYRDIPRYNIQQYFICLWFTYTYLAQKLDILYIYYIHTVAWHLRQPGQDRFLCGESKYVWDSAQILYIVFWEAMAGNDSRFNQRWGQRALLVGI